MRSLSARLRKLEKQSGADALETLDYDLMPTPDQLAQIDAAEKQGQRLFVHERFDRLVGWLTCCGLPRPWLAGTTPWQVLATVPPMTVDAWTALAIPQQAALLMANHD